MIKRFVEWIKGGIHDSESCIDMQSVTGTIPKYGRWSEEPYRFQVWVFRRVITRDAAWVKPITTYRYEVRPMTEHLIPIDFRGGSIYVTEKAGAYVIDYPVCTVAEAADAYVEYVLGERMRYIEKA